MEHLVALAQSGRGEPWNKGKLVGQKAPLRLKEIWAFRIRLQLAERTRVLAPFNLAVDSKLRSCDLVTLRVRDITHGERIAARAIVMQQKTQRPVQTGQPIADRPQNATKRNYMSPDMTPTGVRYSLNRTRRGFCRSPTARFHSPPIIRAACRRPRQWVRRALADIPPPRSHPPTVASPAARRSANAAQAPACRARMNSGT